MESDDDDFQRESGSPSAVTKYLDGIEEREAEKDHKRTKSIPKEEDDSRSSSSNEKKIDTSMEGPEEDVSLEDVNLTTPTHKPPAQPVLTSGDLIASDRPSGVKAGQRLSGMDDLESDYHDTGDKKVIEDVEQEEEGRTEDEVEYDFEGDPIDYGKFPYSWKKKRAFPFKMAFYLGYGFYRSAFWIGEKVSNLFGITEHRFKYERQMREKMDESIEKRELAEAKEDDEAAAKMEEDIQPEDMQ